MRFGALWQSSDCALKNNGGMRDALVLGIALFKGVRGPVPDGQAGIEVFHCGLG